MPNRRLGITRFLAFLFYCAFLKCLKPSTGLARQPSPAAASATGSAAEGQGTDGGRGGSGSDDDDGDDPRTGMRQHRLLGSGSAFGSAVDHQALRRLRSPLRRRAHAKPAHHRHASEATLSNTPVPPSASAPADWRSSARTAYGPLRRGPRQAARRSCRAPPLPPPPRTP